MLIASVLSLAFALPQNPWIVDSAGGAGANFTDLPAAVAAAAHGDTILVRGATGPYQYYS